MAKAKTNERKELSKNAAAAVKLWEGLRGLEKDKPTYRLANALAELCGGLVETADDLDENWDKIQLWQDGEDEEPAAGAEGGGGAEPDDEAPSVVVLEFRNQFLEDGQKVAAALREAMRCDELVAMDGFEEALVATTGMAAGAWALLAMIKRK